MTLTTHHPFLDRGPDRARAESHNDAPPAHRVEKATTLVRTQALSEHGIDQIRVLSESKFLGLVRNMVEESLHAHIDAAREEAPPRPPAASPPPAAFAAAERPTPTAPAEAHAERNVEHSYQKKWDELRSRHESQLRRVESGMRRLSATFASIRETLDRLRGGADHAVVAEAAPAPREDSLSKHRALLREMLL